MALSLETLDTLGPPALESLRGTRYRAEDQVVDMTDLAPQDRPVVRAIYEMLDALEAVVGTELHDASALDAFTTAHDMGRLLQDARQLGAGGADDRVALAVHDIRGGALTSLFAQMSRLKVLPFRKEIGRALFIAARDHKKMMRNVIRDLDPPARQRDLAFVPHSLADLSRAMREFDGNVGGLRVQVDVHCESDAVIAESCVECAAIDRVAYNLLNNAVRHASTPAISAWLVTLEHDLRVAIANAISPEQKKTVAATLAENPQSVFGTFTTTGSGYGLRIVSELVGHAYGIASTEALVEGCYVGARVIDDAFVSWFHWPLSGA